MVSAVICRLISSNPLQILQYELYSSRIKMAILLTISTGKWPKAKLLLSPRVGFRWKVPDEKGLVIRGGTGVFTGKIPFVFLTNLPSNSGVYQTGAVINTSC